MEKSIHHEAFYCCLNKGNVDASGITAAKWVLQVLDWIGADQEAP